MQVSVCQWGPICNSISVQCISKGYVTDVLMFIKHKKHNFFNAILNDFRSFCYVDQNYYKELNLRPIKKYDKIHPLPPPPPSSFHFHPFHFPFLSVLPMCVFLHLFSLFFFNPKKHRHLTQKDEFFMLYT